MRAAELDPILRATMVKVILGDSLKYVEFHAVTTLAKKRGIIICRMQFKTSLICAMGKERIIAIVDTVGAVTIVQLTCLYKVISYDWLWSCFASVWTLNKGTFHTI